MVVACVVCRRPVTATQARRQEVRSAAHRRQGACGARRRVGRGGQQACLAPAMAHPCTWARHPAGETDGVAAAGVAAESAAGVAMTGLLPLHRPSKSHLVLVHGTAIETATESESVSVSVSASARASGSGIAAVTKHRLLRLRRSGGRAMPRQGKARAVRSRRVIVAGDVTAEVLAVKRLAATSAATSAALSVGVSLSGCIAGMSPRRRVAVVVAAAAARIVPLDAQTSGGEVRRGARGAMSAVRARSLTRVLPRVMLPEALPTSAMLHGVRAMSSHLGTLLLLAKVEGSADVRPKPSAPPRCKAAAAGKPRLRVGTGASCRACSCLRAVGECLSLRVWSPSTPMLLPRRRSHR
jgi:hypothetical protein